MTTANRDPLPRLADALADVSDRLRDIGTELRALQAVTTVARPEPALHQPQTAPHPGYAQPGYPPAPATYPPAMPVDPTYPPAQQAPSGDYPGYPSDPRHAGYAAPATHPQRPAVPAGPTLWERLSREGAGSRMLGWAGGTVTLVGVLLLLVLAIQRGYVGPLPRVLLGAVLGTALVGIGLRLHRTPGGRSGAHAVAATGVAVLFLTTIAATTLYRYLPDAAGLAAGLVVAGAGIGIALRWDSQLFATYVVACTAVSAPVLTGGLVPMLVGFLLVLQIASTPVQLSRRWSALALAAGVPPVAAVLLGVCLDSLRHDSSGTSTAWLCLATGAVQVVVSTLSARRTDADLNLALLLAGPVPTLLAAGLLVPRGLGVVLLATLIALLSAVWTLHRLGLLAVSDRFALAAGGGAAMSLFEAVCLGIGGSVRAIALLAVSVLLALAAGRLRDRAGLVAAVVFGAAGLLLALTVALRLRTLVLAPAGRVPLHAVATAGTTGLLVAVTALVVATVNARLARTEHRPVDAADERIGWTLAGAVVLYGASGAVLSIGLAISPDRHGFLIGHVLVTVSWTLAALVLLLRHIDSTPLRVAGLALVGAALAKLVAFDLASLSGIPRVLAFLGAGLVLLAAGARYAGLVADRRHPAPSDEQAADLPGPATTTAQ